MAESTVKGPRSPPHPSSSPHHSAAAEPVEGRQSIAAQKHNLGRAHHRAEEEAYLQLKHDPSAPFIEPLTLSSPTFSLPYPPTEAPKLSLPHQSDANGLLSNFDNSDYTNCLPHVGSGMNRPADEYRWRKYGQKRVKSSEVLRSYFRCTNPDCRAKKKVRQWDQSHRVIDVVYIGDHNHHPPQRGRQPIVVADPAAKGLDMSIPPQNVNRSSLQMPEPEEPCPSSCNCNVKIKVEEQNCDEPQSEQLFCASWIASWQTALFGFAGTEARRAMILKSGRKKRQVPRGTWLKRELHSLPDLNSKKRTKILVQNVADKGISDDGYRWRKYGQKTVKGNSYIRSYYRCTSAGCPVRKHVERARDAATFTMITYEGEHDHNETTLRKQHGQEGLARNSSTAAINDTLCNKTESSPGEKPLTERSEGMEGDLMGERVLELGGEKALESARALLSIGIALRPC